MGIGAAIAGGVGLVGSVISGNKQSKAAQAQADATNKSTEAAQELADKSRKDLQAGKAGALQDLNISVYGGQYSLPSDQREQLEDQARAEYKSLYGTATDTKQGLASALNRAGVNFTDSELQTLRARPDIALEVARKLGIKVPREDRSDASQYVLGEINKRRAQIQKDYTQHTDFAGKPNLTRARRPAMSGPKMSEQEYIDRFLEKHQGPKVKGAMDYLQDGYDGAKANLTKGYRAATDQHNKGYNAALGELAEYEGDINEEFEAILALASEENPQLQETINQYKQDVNQMAAARGQFKSGVNAEALARGMGDIRYRDFDNRRNLTVGAHNNKTNRLGNLRSTTANLHSQHHSNLGNLDQTYHNNQANLVNDLGRNQANLGWGLGQSRASIHTTTGNALMANNANLSNTVSQNALTHGQIQGNLLDQQAFSWGNLGNAGFSYLGTELANKWGKK